MSSCLQWKGFNKQQVARIRYENASKRECVRETERRRTAKVQKFVQSVSTRHTEKRKKMLTESVNSTKPHGWFPRQPEIYVHNHSSITLSNVLTEALSLGTKFCYSRRHVNTADVETQFEILFDQVSGLVPSSDFNVEQLNSTLVNSCYQCIANKTMTNHLL